MLLKKCPPGQTKNNQLGGVKKDIQFEKLVKKVPWGKQAPKSPIKNFPK